MSKETRDTAQPRQPWQEVKSTAYRAMADRVERECSVREPHDNPFAGVPFYQVMDLLAAAVGHALDDVMPVTEKEN